VNAEPQSEAIAMAKAIVKIDSAVVEGSLNKSGAYIAEVNLPDGTRHELTDVLWGSNNTKLVLTAIVDALGIIPDDQAVEVHTSDYRVYLWFKRSEKWGGVDPQRAITNRRDADYWVRFSSAKRGRTVTCICMTPVVNESHWHKCVDMAHRSAIPLYDTEQEAQMPLPF
jgi:hypothetical protein